MGLANSLAERSTAGIRKAAAGQFFITPESPAAVSAASRLPTLGQTLRKSRKTEAYRSNSCFAVFSLLPGHAHKYGGAASGAAFYIKRATKQGGPFTHSDQAKPLSFPAIASIAGGIKA